MRSNIGIENMATETLREWLAAYREDIRNGIESPAFGWKAHAWAKRTCARIVLILARRNENRRYPEK